jgi:hypothetical protein
MDRGRAHRGGDAPPLLDLAPGVHSRVRTALPWRLGSSCGEWTRVLGAVGTRYLFVPAAEQAAQDAPCPWWQPEADLGARSGHRRHLLGEALRTACHGHHGILAQPAPGSVPPPHRVRGRELEGHLGAWEQA